MGKLKGRLKSNEHNPHMTFYLSFGVLRSCITKWHYMLSFPNFRIVSYNTFKEIVSIPSELIAMTVSPLVHYQIPIAEDKIK